MAKMSGRSGRVLWNADEAGEITIGCVTSWSAEISCDTADVTCMGTSTFNKQYVATFSDWTATVEVVFDEDSDVPAIGEGGADSDSYYQLLLSLASAATDPWGIDYAKGVWHGPAICTGASQSVGMNDAITISFTFQGTGAIAYAVADPYA